MAEGPVILCYDGSEAAGHSIALAAPLLAGRRALVAYVYRPAGETAIPIGGVPVGSAPEEVERSALEHAHTISRRGCEIARDAGFEAEPAHVPAHGRVADTIVELARREGAEIVVVGARGLGGVKSALLGSVSGGLVHSGAVPVLVVPPDER
jgi:nucleotide-binding universal stress UspA family protein